ncbi:apolipoprotein N-acyltransferase [Methylocapsa acidiphila]|uniref:apolipoprotein N-acyltransferase n=1 Tax=Methylocapsa acidiphila TaxID=133552 RepID=UPI0003FBA616|nr:apolipoprotein N-acyltransferase [Methylocapsa acidiphila]
MRALAAWITRAESWRRSLLAFAVGAVGALAMAPFDFLPLMMVSMTVGVWLIDGSAEAKAIYSARPRGFAARLVPPRATRRAFAAGWWWGFGYFVAGLWWLGAAFLVDADEFAWALPLGVLGLPAVLAFFPAFGFALAHLLWSSGPGRLFAFAAGLTLAEWLRGHVLTGFPWNNFGMALGDHLVTAQLASVIGLYGLAAITILLSSAPAVLADAAPKPGARDGSLRRWASAPAGVMLFALLAFAAICGFGALRLATADRADVAGVTLRIMQPNLPQDDRFRPENKAEILAHYLRLSDLESATSPAGVTVLIWPESAFPFILSRDRQALALIGAFLSPRTVLVTGAARQENGVPPPPEVVLAADARPRPRYYNAVQVIASGGRILDSYDKVHLVPFGEYLPLRSILEVLGLRNFVHVPGGFEAGPERRTLAVPGLPIVSPLVCYEAIFPGEVEPDWSNGPRPGLLLNLTNDGWFGATAGPHQHFAQARLRAIEEGLPLIRAANTGISAIIDPYGRILAQLPLGAEGLLQGALPQSIARPIFAKAPFSCAFVVWIAMLLAAVVARRNDLTRGYD